MGLSDDDVREILRLIDESDLAELRIDTPDLRLHIRRGDGHDQESRTADVEREDADAAPPQPSSPTPAPSVPKSLHSIDSPMLGVFYRAPAPGAAAYVEPGAHVEPDTVVCLVEVMKMMNSVVAGVSGTIVEVCAENADLVEHGQPLFRVELR